MADFGKIAYEAYGRSVNWTTVSGGSMPSWSDQSDRLKEAWRAAAEAVYDVFAAEG